VYGLGGCGGGGGKLAAPGVLARVGGGLVGPGEEPVVVDGEPGNGVGKLGDEELSAPPAPSKWT
jgi:hypothetical protein